MSDEHHIATWQRLSKKILTQSPLCSDPFNWHSHTGRFAPSECVHHIVSPKDDYDKMFDRSNLLPLCQTCHDAIHAKHDAISRLLTDGVDARLIAAVVARRGGPPG